MKKTVVITGASSGVGRAIALEFAANQHTLIIASPNTTSLQELAAECELPGAKVKVISTNVTNHSDMLNLASQADDIGRIDVWINNARVLAIGKLQLHGT